MRNFPRVALTVAFLGILPAAAAPLPASSWASSSSSPSSSGLSGRVAVPASFLSPVSAQRNAGGGWLDLESSSPGGTAPRPSRTPAGSPANRVAYLGYQTALSTYVYGVGLPIGLGYDNTRTLVAAPLIVAPLAFGAHLASTPHLDFTDAHLKASFYAPTFATYAATALSLAFSPDAGDGYRIGSLIGTAAYPLGLWYGWNLGDRYRDAPEKLDNKMFFALGYGFVGFVTPVLYYERPSRHSQDILRIGLGQSVGMAVAGHFIADHYNPHGMSSGAALGVATHAVLGALGGVAVAAYADASSSPRPWLGAGIIGATLGLTEGVYFFRDSRDSRERSQYAALGAAGGAMMGLGIQILTYDADYSTHAHKISWASFLVGGAYLGYAATYALTGRLTETASLQRQRTEADEPFRLTFNPLPLREQVWSRGELASRWKVPGFTYRF